MQLDAGERSVHKINLSGLEWTAEAQHMCQQQRCSLGAGPCDPGAADVLLLRGAAEGQRPTIEGGKGPEQEQEACSYFDICLLTFTYNYIYILFTFIH